jgi:hypothetical protein
VETAFRCPRQTETGFPGRNRRRAACRTTWEALSGKIGMTNVSKKVILASMGAAGLVALLTITDLALEFPFGRQVGLDIMFLLSAGMVIYLAYDSYREMS